MMNTEKFTNFRTHWIWGLVAGILTLVLAGMGLFFQYQSNRHEYGGLLNNKFHDRHLSNKEARTIVVCVDDTVYLYNNIYLTPTFDNPDEFSLRDFSFVCEVNASNVELVPSEFVKKYKSGISSYYYQYSQDILQAHMDTKNPFAGFKLENDNARCEITSKVSFDGATELYEYRTDVWFIYNPNKRNLSFDYWKMNCKQKIFELVDDKNFDVYYISKNNIPEYQFDVPLTKNINNKPIDDKKEKNNNTEVAKNDTSMMHLGYLTKEEEIANKEIEIEDYKYHYNDSSKLEITFNKPAKYDANFFITFLVKDGWETKKIYGNLHLNKGERTTTVYVWSNPEKIADLTLYHQISAEDRLFVKKIDDNYNIKVSLIHPGVLYAKLIYPDKSTYYIKLSDINNRDIKYDSKIMFEAYTDYGILNKIIEKIGFPISDIVLCSILIVIFVLSLYTFDYIYDHAKEKSTFFFYVMLIAFVSSILFYALIVIYLAYIFIDYLCSYIYLMV